jgi:hypothetical protein
MTETLKIGDQTSVIETKRITLLVPSARASLGPDIEIVGRIPISFHDTTYHASLVQKLHPDFGKYWHLFMSNTNPVTVVNYEVKPDVIRKMGMAANHLMGLIDLSLKYKQMGVNFFWKLPESSLHPGWAVALGDLIIALSEQN